MEKNVERMFVKLSDFSDISHLANIASTTVADKVTVYKDIYVVNGKSLMGLLSLNMADGVTIEYPQGSKALESYLMNFKAE